MHIHTHAFLETVKSKTRHILMLQRCADINTELKQFLVFVGTKYFEKLKQAILKKKKKKVKPKQTCMKVPSLMLAPELEYRIYNCLFM